MVALLTAKFVIKNAVFYAENFNKITKFLQELDSSQSEPVANVKILSENRDVKIELLAVHKFNFLVQSITMLETQGLSKARQWEIL